MKISIYIAAGLVALMGFNSCSSSYLDIDDTNYLGEKEAANAAERKSKIGTGDRSEKIRTYNYPQNRVTDHRIGFTSMNLDRIMNGDLGVIIEALIAENQRLELENHEI